MVSLSACNGRTAPGTIEHTSNPASQPAPVSPAPQTGSAPPGTSPRASLPNTDCTAIPLAPPFIVQPNVSLSRSFNLPQDVEVLRISARWGDERRRKLAVGTGACPPCNPLTHTKGLNHIEQDFVPGAHGLSARDFTAGRPWFMVVSVDPEDDRLDQAPPTLQAQSCQVDPSATTTNSLFPPDDLVIDSLTVIEQDAFGFEQLRDVHTAHYQRAASDLLAYVISTDSPAAASTLVASYHDFLVGVGGQSRDIDFGHEVRLWGYTTVILSAGAQVLGVQEAKDPEAARALAMELHAWVLRNPRPPG